MPELYEQLGLTREEYEAICGLQGREPTHVELAMFSLMWSEHCGYKHSRPLLKRLPTTGERILQGPGENAGIVDIGGGLAVAMKMESHNHPSAVEPYQGAATGVGARGFALVGVSLPSFWLGPLLILAFSIGLGWLPVSGRAGPASLVLPAMTLGLGLAALLTRMVRTAVAEELGRPYVVTALARGLSRRAALWRHALPNALIPVVTVLGLQFGGLLTGAILTETIFAWPGLGRLLIQAIRLRDYPLVQGAVLLIAGIYLLVNLATDLLYARLDPRVRLGGGQPA